MWDLMRCLVRGPQAQKLGGSRIVALFFGVYSYLTCTFFMHITMLIGSAIRKPPKTVRHLH